LLDEREAKQFRAVVWRPVSERLAEQGGPEAAPQVTPQVGTLLTVMEGEMARQAVMEALSLRDRKHFAEAYLLPALMVGLIEVAIPDKPNSSKQRYRITERGLKLLADKNTRGLA
jgi:ATP-dependent DNA helicase RecG